MILILDDEETGESDEVEVDLDLSTHMNIQRYYQDKKKDAIKEKKTVEKTSQVIKKAEITATKKIQQEKDKFKYLQKIRKRFW